MKLTEAALSYWDILYFFNKKGTYIPIPFSSFTPKF